jgi:two-component system, NtrC family, response regulator HydG
MKKKPLVPFSSKFFSQVISSMADGLFIMDEAGKIVTWNPSMERISGYTAKEAVGRTCELLQCSHCFGQECPADIKKCGVTRHGGIEAKECMIRHKDGQGVSVIKCASAVLAENGRLLGIVETVTDMTELVKARQRAEEAVRLLGEAHRFADIIGKSDAMRQVFTAIKAAAASDATTLIHGESGTGKELVAGAIHFNSSRAQGPLVTVNCSALPETLLESELFGHVRGAFTGASRDRVGRFEEADSGTIFLDEIGDLSPFIQVKLLRVLQERQIERVGESKRRPVNIRVITATNLDLQALVLEGRFREDLYYRLKVFPIRIPPLRERKEDIPLLVSHFIAGQNRKTGKRILGLTPDAMRLIMDHPWPGNVRELENAIEHAFVLCTADRIDTLDLPLDIRSAGSAAQPDIFRQPSPHPTRRLTREKLKALLRTCDYNKAEAARRLGISRTAVWKYMKKWGIPLQPEQLPAGTDRR